MAKSRNTKKNLTWCVILTILSCLLWLAPIGIFGFLALMEGTLLYQKVSLAVTVFIVLIMTLISLTSKIALRSRLWILLLGIYICLQNIMTPIIVFAVCQILDELVVTPLKDHFKRKYQINKEIDGRI